MELDLKIAIYSSGLRKDIREKLFQYIEDIEAENRKLKEKHRSDKKWQVMNLKFLVKMH